MTTRFSDLVGRTVKSVHIQPEYNRVVLEVGGWFGGRSFTFGGMLTGESGDPGMLLDEKIGDCYCDEIVDRDGYGYESAVHSNVVVETTNGIRIVFFFAGYATID
jgi:hypothetical protein